MKFKVFFSMMLGCAMMVSAQSQGYKDGIEYYKAGQYENAKTILQNTIASPDTDKAMANYYLGQTYLALKDNAKAQQCFNTGVEIAPENPYNYVGLGALALLNNNPKEAEAQFKTALKLGKKNHEITVAIARAYYNADPVAYAKDVEKYLAKAHKDSKHNEPSIYILEGDMLADKGDFGGAAGKYEMAIRYDNNNPEGYVKYANSYFRVNPQFAIQKLEEFLTVAPESALGQRELAEKYYQANMWNKAAEQYGRYIHNPNHFPEDKSRYSVLLYYGEKYPESLQVANDLLAINPNDFLMQRLRFLNEYQLKDYTNSVAHAASFFANNPDGYFTAGDYSTYGDALQALGQDSLAVVQYEAGVAKYPDNGALLSNLSGLYSNLKDYVKAAKTYDAYMATLESPSVQDYLTGSGRQLFAAATAGDNAAARSEAYTKGLEYINKTISMAVPNPYLLQRKARIEIAGNNSMPNAAAIQVYNDMVKMLDENPANMDASNPDNALKLYNEAYQFAVLFYTKVEPNTEKASHYSALLKTVSDKLAQ